MKIRTDFVTNSSSSSFIICFARIANEEKARPILEKYNIVALDKDDVNDEKNAYGKLGATWCGAVIYGTDDTIENHPNDKFIIIEDCNDAIYDEDGEMFYDYDYEQMEAINAITEENGFADIEVAEGEGRNG
jgi:hypothetical protein